MAKTSTAPRAKKPKGAIETERQQVFNVTAEEHGPADVAAALGQGLRLRWPDPTKFFAVPLSIFEKMSREDQQQYNVARNRFLEWEKSLKIPINEAAIIQLRPTNAKERKAIDHPADMHIFYASIEGAYEAARKGYHFVDVKDTRLKPHIPSRVPVGLPESFKRLVEEKGTKLENCHFISKENSDLGDLVAMWIPQERFMASERARSLRQHKLVDAAGLDLQEQIQDMAARSGEDFSRYGDRYKGSTKSVQREMTLVPDAGGET